MSKYITANMNDNLWNERYPKRPKVGQRLCPKFMFAKATRLRDILVEFSCKLKSENIHSEFVILRQIMRRVGIVSMNDKVWKFVQQVDRCLKRYEDMKLGTFFTHTLSKLPVVTEQHKHNTVIPSNNQFKFIMNRLLGLAKLMMQTRAYCINALAELQARLKLGNAASDYVTLMALLSRIVVICQAIVLSIPELYEIALDCYVQLKNIEVEKTPENIENFPSDIWKWLGMSPEEFHPDFVPTVTYPKEMSSLPDIQSISKLNHQLGSVSEAEHTENPKSDFTERNSKYMKIDNQTSNQLAYKWAESEDLGTGVTISAVPQVTDSVQNTACDGVKREDNLKCKDLVIVLHQIDQKEEQQKQVELPKVRTIKELRKLWKNICNRNHKNKKNANVHLHQLTPLQKQRCEQIVRQTCREIIQLKQTMREKLSNAIKSMEHVIETGEPDLPDSNVKETGSAQNGEDANTLALINGHIEDGDQNGSNNIKCYMTRNRIKIKHQKRTSINQLKVHFKYIRNYKDFRKLILQVCDTSENDVNKLLPHTFTSVKKHKLKKEYIARIIKLKKLVANQGQLLTTTKLAKNVRDFWKDIRKEF